MRERDLHTGPRGLRLRICEWGQTSGRATLILHGWLEQGAAWDQVAQELPGRVVAPDHRGHGRSEHIGAGGFYHFWDYVADVDALVADLGGEVDLVGHSMGGTMAALYAGCRPDAVRRLVLVEGLGPPDGTEQALTRAREFLDHRRRPPRHGALRDAEEAALRMRRFNPAIPEAHALELARRTTRPIAPGDPQTEATEGLTWTWDAMHRARSPQPFQTSLFLRFVRAIRAPTLLVYGADSPYRMPDLAEREAALAHARRVVVPGAGHLLHHDCPAELARLLRDHLETP